MAAHLAGSLAVPVWTLLHAGCDWRWMAGRDDSPWYPTMRLFRQEQPEVWAPGVACAARELARLGEDHSGSRVVGGVSGNRGPAPSTGR